MDCYHLQENEKKNYWIDTGLKASTQVVRKASNCLGNKTADAVTVKR